MNNYRIGGGGVKSTSKWWGQATQLVLTIFSGVNLVALFIHIKLPVISLTP